MAQEVMEMSDLTADVLDVISAIWLKRAAHPESTVWFTVDDFLRYRGLKPQKSGSGRRGGYKDAWRNEIARQVGILGDFWITVQQMEVTKVSGSKRTRTTWAGESRALVLSSRFGQRTSGDSLDAYAWRGRPGDVFSKWLFGPGRQTALLCQRALRYNPHRQKWEKRLTRYLSYQWRIRQSRGDYPGPFLVQTLLLGIGQQVNKNDPGRTRDRLEKALNTLQDDGVIAGWQYESINEETLGQRGWWKTWLNLKVLIEPPPQIPEQYAKIKHHVHAPALPKPDALPIKQARQERGLTILQAAEEIGISASRLSRLERGETPSPSTRRKLERWLSKKP
jgi:DNA-binding XRE family transcriptional regulator